MKGALPTQGSLERVIRNLDHVYEGDLTHYFRVIFFFAQNLARPYHDFRHMTHVTWLGYDACLFYRGQISPRRMRNMLIAAIFHDFDHAGMLGNDDLNIERSIRGLRTHILPVDFPHIAEIEQLLRGTEYPHKIAAAELSLCGLILRDADVAQGFSTAWLQQVVFGLAAEWGKAPLEVLKTQEPFLGSLHFNTEWAKTRFPKEAIDAKIAEARGLVALLTGESLQAA